EPDYLKHPADWYRFNQNLYLLDPASPIINDLGVYPLTARAGAAAVSLGDNSLLLINGEVKPGVRTPSIIKITIQ
ncbi:MAG: cyclically-permuted mutarotase family protein, partial [Muribaculaceae bacterium]|nr:cyclically-permuted mutarotase family protein [Muribaculaceae bacterium]